MCGWRDQGHNKLCSSSRTSPTEEGLEASSFAVTALHLCAKLFRAGGSHIGIRWRFSPLQIALLPDNRRRLIAAACELYDLIGSTPEGRALLQSTVIRATSTETTAPETSTETSSAQASSAHGDDVLGERPQRRLIAVEPPPSACTRLCRFLSSLEWSWFPKK